MCDFIIYFCLYYKFRFCWCFCCWRDTHQQNKNKNNEMWIFIIRNEIKAWGLGLIWIILSCTWGLAKPIDKILSHRALLPFSRLTYCAYLVHPVTQIIMSFDLKGTIHIQHSLVLTIFMGNIIISYSFALLMALLFEAPVVRILKTLFGKFWMQN